MYNTYTLKNGLRVITEKIDHFNSISVGIMIQNGSRNESEELNGISHFIEHMFFKGTERRNAKQIVQEIENVGGQINAFTSKEATCYYIKALNTHLDKSIDILSDMILHSKFDEEEIEKEKGVVIEEINMSSDSPEDVLDDAHSLACFGNTPLGRPILGTINHIKSFDRKKILNFIQKKYTPYNSVISVCGNFDSNVLKELLEQYFGDWNSEEKYIPKYEEIKIKTGSEYVNKEIEQVHVSLGLRGVPYADNNNYSLVLLNNILGGGASSILFQKIREQLGLCYSIGTYLQPFQKTGTINIYAGLNKNLAEKAVYAIYKELRNFTNLSLSEEKIAINKEKMKATYILGLESTSARMFANAKTYLFRNIMRTPDDVLKKIDEVNEESIRNILDVCFKDGILNAAYVGNDVDYKKIDSIIFKDTKAYDNTHGNKIEI